MGGAPSPGWYPDPHGSGRERYWSGSAWGPLERPVPAAATAGMSRRAMIVVGGIAAALVTVYVIGAVVNANNKSGSSSEAIQAATTTVAPTSAPESEFDFKTGSAGVTIGQLVNSPSSYAGEAVTFTGRVSRFLQDDNGLTSAMQVADIRDPGSLVYVAIGADPTKMNTNDVVQIWGEMEGIVTGQNAFGGTSHQPEVNEIYLQDHSSGYVDDPDVTGTIPIG